MTYTPLNIVSSYSLLNSTISVDELISTAKQRGYNSLALTDENVMYGAIEFYDKCLANNIHPIIGLTLQVSNFTATDSKNELVLLAKNNEGYQNLMKLSSIAMTSDEQKVDVNELIKYLSGIVLIIPDYGEWQQIISSKQLSIITDFIENIANSMDLNNVYWGIGANNINSDSYVQTLHELQDQFKVRLIALSHIRNLNSDDYFSLKVMQNIENGQKLANPLQENHEKATEWLKPSVDILNEYASANLKDAIANNEKVSASCKVVIEKRQPVLPKFDNHKGMSSKDFLTDLCVKGLKQRLIELNIDKNKYVEYKQRLVKELDVINRMGFNDYFLIVWDVINYAHEQNVMTGPGRGSAAGSLVSFCLYITDVDPIEYDLLFERFLNEQRAQMPDIDLDIPDNKRGLILNYVHEKYGDKHVGQIVTFDTMAAKQVLRDVGRTFGLSKFEMDDWSKAIPSTAGKITLQAAYEQSQKLKNIVSDNSLNQLLFKTAMKLEGLPRHSSTHAAGLILSKNPIIETSPLQNGNDGLLMTQYSKNYVEKIGLLKIDFLGLRNLSILDNIVSLVNNEVDPNFDIRKINLNDASTLRLFQSGDTNGIFQFESNGIKKVLRSLHPDNFNLVAAVDALYRPGPMENIDTFIKRKKGQEKVQFADDSLIPILGPTYGIIVYQEQVMRVASVMGGFSLGEADLLRRAMSKKKRDVMDSMKSKFINGAINKSYSEATARQTFDYIERFASYGFNKSHAVAYSKMAFELAYLKTHYSQQFFIGLLNSVLNNHVKTKTYIAEAKRRNIQVLAPNINTSQKEFTVDHGKILFGFASIKGLRSDFIRDLLEQRKVHGPFKGLEELIYRIDPKYRNRDLLNSLIYVGALDGFGYHRSELLASVQEFIETIKLSGTSMELFQELKPKMKHLDEMSLNEKLNYEEQYVGVYLSGHPVEEYAILEKPLSIVSSDMISSHTDKINCMFYTENVKKIRTHKGDEMCFVSGTDLSGNINLTVFPNVFKKIKGWIRKGIVVVVNGAPEKRNNEYQVIADKVVPAANIKSRLVKKQSTNASKKWYLKIDDQHNNTDTLKRVFAVMKNNPGNHQVIVYKTSDDSKKILDNKFNLDSNQTLFNKLIVLLGKGNVVYK